jgi:hypothetical protein
MAYQGQDPHRYDDIINLPHPVSSTHPPMAAESRAAQFAPFAALTGYGEEIEETGRLTDKRVELDESRKAMLDEKLQMLLEQADEAPEVSITYFVPDAKKAGGAYVTVTGRIRRLDAYTRTLLMKDDTIIPLDEIFDIEPAV